MLAALEREFREHPFPIFDELIAPRRQMKKAQFLAYVIRRMEKEGRRQGDRVGAP